MRPTIGIYLTLAEWRADRTGIPTLYAYAYREDDRDVVRLYPKPLHLVMRWLHALRQARLQVAWYLREAKRNERWREER